MGRRIRKGDTVEVRTGKFRGARGNVISVSGDRARVERVNMVKKHAKPSRQNAQGGIIEKEASVHVSNLALVHNGDITRIGFRRVDGQPVRWSKKHDEAIDG